MIHVTCRDDYSTRQFVTGYLSLTSYNSQNSHSKITLTTYLISLIITLRIISVV